jgi:hypothetical protein
VLLPAAYCLLPACCLLLPATYVGAVAAAAVALGLPILIPGETKAPLHAYNRSHYARTQALRIMVNEEFDQLREGMQASFEVMKAGGRVGVLTWKHSECAIVVDFHKQHECSTMDFPLLKWYHDKRAAAKREKSKFKNKNKQKERTVEVDPLSVCAVDSLTRACVALIVSHTCYVCPKRRCPSCRNFLTSGG